MVRLSTGFSTVHLTIKPDPRGRWRLGLDASALFRCGGRGAQPCPCIQIDLGGLRREPCSRLSSERSTHPDVRGSFSGDSACKLLAHGEPAVMGAGAVGVADRN